MISADQIEALAIRAAKGNNGGEWLKTPDGEQHYTPEQKDYWRQWVRDLEAAVLDDISQHLQKALAEALDHSIHGQRLHIIGRQNRHDDGAVAAELSHVA